MIPLKNITIDYKINTEERRDISRRRFDVVAEKRITSDVRMESITITIDTADNDNLDETKGQRMW